MKNIALILISIFLVAGCANSQNQQKGTIENVDAARFRQLADAGNGIVLDVRTPGEVSEGYIANAVNYDFYEDDFEARIKKLDKSKEVYVYCAGGGRSYDAAKILQKQGFPKVYNLKDGFHDWKKKGYPSVKPK